MSELTIVDVRVVEFTELVNLGIDAWQRAGKVLCDLLQDDPDAQRVILAQSPHLTAEILETFARIGRRELYAYLAVDGTPGARRLALLPYDQQVQLYRGKVMVTISTPDGPVEREKRICDLTKGEAQRVIGENGIRTATEQRRLLLHTGGKVRATRQRREEEEALPGDIDDVARLDNEPRAELVRHLTLANGHLIEARTALALVKRESRQDVHITAALGAIGRLRFAVNEGEL